MRAARDFIRELELVFALLGNAYSLEREKVLYGVMFLAGDAHEQWHLNHSVTDLEGYTFDDFKAFVRDAVEDPANRVISVTLSYERARQKEGQTVSAFATYLDTLEDQLPRYTEEQRVLHLLAKLAPKLRKGIVKYHNIPAKRKDLVALATRIESSDKTMSQKRPYPEPGRQGGEGSKRMRAERSSGASQPPRKSTSSAPPSGKTEKDVLSNIECWNCHEKGHYANKCPRAASTTQSVRQITAGDKPTRRESTSGKGQGQEKSRT
jgi:hypothetical protein